MSAVPPVLTLAQVTKLEKLPEDARVVGYQHGAPPGPIIRQLDGPLRVIKPDGRMVKAH